MIKETPKGLLSELRFSWAETKSGIERNWSDLLRTRLLNKASGAFAIVDEYISDDEMSAAMTWVRLYSSGRPNRLFRAYISQWSACDSHMHWIDLKCGLLLGIGSCLASDQRRCSKDWANERVWEERKEYDMNWKTGQKCHIQKSRAVLCNLATRHLLKSTQPTKLVLIHPYLIIYTFNK